jgi:hypothetical protein
MTLTNYRPLTLSQYESTAILHSEDEKANKSTATVQIKDLDRKSENSG